MSQKNHAILSLIRLNVKYTVNIFFLLFSLCSNRVSSFDSAFDTMDRRKTRCHSLSSLSLFFSSMNIPLSFFLTHWCSLSLRWYLYWLLKKREININQWKMIYSRFCLFERENTNERCWSKGRRKNLIPNRSLFFLFFLKLFGMLIQIISRREDYRLYIHSIIESTSLFFCVLSKSNLICFFFIIHCRHGDICIFIITANMNFVVFFSRDFLSYFSF